MATTINGLQLRVGSIPKTAIDAAFDTYLSGMSTSITDIYSIMSTDTERVAAINAVTAAWEAADSSMTTTFNSRFIATIPAAGRAGNGGYTAPGVGNYLGGVT